MTTYTVESVTKTVDLARGDIRYLDHAAAVEAVAVLALRETFGAEL